MPVLLYTEATPNPETLKFVCNKPFLERGFLEFTESAAAEKISPLAIELFTFPAVKGVFIASNFVTITKDGNATWAEIIPTLRQFLKDYVNENKAIVTDEWIEEQANKKPEDLDPADIETKIIELLDKYVRPAVEMDGGAIIFDSFEDGIVKLKMQGSCSGCPSSSVTLKSGIENMLKKMIPEVTEVVATE